MSPKPRTVPHTERRTDARSVKDRRNAPIPASATKTKRKAFGRKVLVTRGFERIEKSTQAYEAQTAFFEEIADQLNIRVEDIEAIHAQKKPEKAGEKFFVAEVNVAGDTKYVKVKSTPAVQKSLQEFKKAREAVESYD